MGDFFSYGQCLCCFWSVQKVNNTSLREKRLDTGSRYMVRKGEVCDFHFPRGFCFV